MQNRKHAPAIVATLNLTDEEHRRIHDAIRRTHTGRWPSWKALSMRQVGSAIYEAAQEIPRRKTQRASYFLIKWSLDPCGISWTPAPSRKTALAMLTAAL